MNDPREAEAIDPALAEVWGRNLPAIRGRVEVLERAAAAAASGGEVDPDGEAVAAAHRLAGSLGSFGLARGSELARELEDMLEAGKGTAGAQEIGRRVAELRGLIER